MLGNLNNKLHSEKFVWTGWWTGVRLSSPPPQLGHKINCFVSFFINKKLPFTEKWWVVKDNPLNDYLYTDISIRLSLLTFLLKANTFNYIRDSKINFWYAKASGMLILAYFALRRKIWLDVRLFARHSCVWNTSYTLL